MKHLIIIAACSLLSFPFSVALATPAPAQVPQTGQSTCYNTAGEFIDCSGTGQDGELLAGVLWPIQRFTDHGDETITDNLTGLIWTKNADAGAMDWQGALDDIKAKNSGNYLGHSDWRLPNSNELESLINKEEISTPELLRMQGFFNLEDTQYWSSSSYYGPFTAPSAWVVFMADGFVYHYDKTFYSHVWPVRSGQSPGYLSLAKTGQSICYDTAGTEIACSGSGHDGELQSGAEWPSPRFTDNGDQTIADNLTEPIWHRNANITGVAKTWQEALDYIKSMNNSTDITVNLGHNDWRLPNSNELESIANKGQSNLAAWLNANYFSNVQPQKYWSSSTAAAETAKAWYVNMGDGYLEGDDKTNVNYLRPVRDVRPVRDGIFSKAPGKTYPDISDAQRAMKIASGLIVPTPEDLSHGDLAPLDIHRRSKGNNTIDIYDVIAILLKSVGL